MRVEKDGVQKLQILPSGYMGVNGTANTAIPFLVNADTGSLLAARLYSTDAGAGDGPILNFLRESASPANGDALGFLSFNGKTTGNAERTFAAIRSQAIVVADATSQGGLFGLVDNAGVLVQSFAAFRDSFYISGPLFVNGTQVLGARNTGWGAFTGTTNKATVYATGTITLVQLAERVAAIQAALTTHGSLGA